ncbi:MAG: hypothetical protein J6S28_01740, partial [Clostridia bacterium]|nr:hypothetical protein [Clostridia bacterium]
MKKTIKLFSVLLTLLLAASIFAGCVAPNPDPEQKPTLDNVNVMVLNGTTGFGMAKPVVPLSTMTFTFSSVGFCSGSGFGATQPANIEAASKSV